MGSLSAQPLETMTLYALREVIGRVLHFGWFASHWDQFCTIADLEVLLRSLEALVVDTWKSQLGV